LFSQKENGPKLFHQLQNRTRSNKSKRSGKQTPCRHLFNIESNGSTNNPIKVICSYYQGWLMVPVHVERQLVFLFVRKAGNKKQPIDGICELVWEKRNRCPACKIT
jgi:hypothetical protein